MKLSTKVEYGMAALADIAMHSRNGQKVSTSEIAQRQQISQKYLEQILMLLRQAGFVIAVKGQKGGYTLSRPASNIRLSDLLNALDNNILAEATDIDTESILRASVKTCLWDKMNAFLLDFANSLTLEEFLAQCGSPEESGDMYVI